MKNIFNILFKYKRIYLVLLFPLGYILTMLSKINPYVTEFYTANIYRPISSIISAVTGLAPFSLLEFSLVIILPVFIFYLIISVFSKKRQGLLDGVVHSLSNLIAVASSLYLVFVLMCGVNYHRLPLSHHLGLEVKDSSPSELYQLCTQLISQTNDLASQIPRNEEGVAELSFAEGVGKASQDSYEETAKEYLILDGLFPITPKAVTLSYYMSYTDITGVFSPFTLEANYNDHVPGFFIPSTITHEMAHLRGFMREDEANFIGYLTTAHSSDPQIAYSGTILATIHSMNALYRADIDLFSQAYDLYSSQVRTDLSYHSSYWKAFEGPVSETVTQVNDNYLKANDQTDGVQSYGRMVDLLIAYHR